MQKAYNRLQLLASPQGVRDDGFVSYYALKRCEGLLAGEVLEQSVTTVKDARERWKEVPGCIGFTVFDRIVHDKQVTTVEFRGRGIFYSPHQSIEQWPILKTAEMTLEEAKHECSSNPILRQTYLAFFPS